MVAWQQVPGNNVLLFVRYCCAAVGVPIQPSGVEGGESLLCARTWIWGAGRLGWWWNSETGWEFGLEKSLGLETNFSILGSVTCVLCDCLILFLKYTVGPQYLHPLVSILFIMKSGLLFTLGLQPTLHRPCARVQKPPDVPSTHFQPHPLRPKVPYLQTIKSVDSVNTWMRGAHCILNHLCT